VFLVECKFKGNIEKAGSCLNL